MPSARPHPSAAAAFAPPSAQQVAAHLDAHPPTGPTPWAVWGPMAVLVLVLLLALGSSSPLAGFLPWAALIGVIGWTTWRRRQTVLLERRVALAAELAVLRQYARCLRLAWRLLPQTTAYPPLHGRAVAAMAHALDALNCPQAAVAVYAGIIERMPAHHPSTVLFKLQRAVADLRCDHLFDADEGLRRLRGPVESMNLPELSAMHRVALLTQQVKTGHFAEGAQHSPRLLRELRPLGVEAGYGHALMAVCFHHLRQSPQHPQAAQRRDRWWSRATLLLPAAAILGRIPEARDLVESQVERISDPDPELQSEAQSTAQPPTDV